MMEFSRLNFETRQIEKKLNPLYKDLHEVVLGQEKQALRFVEAGRLRWLSASLWLRAQASAPEKLPEVLPEPEKIKGELREEVRAIMSDYGNLCLKGLRLFLIFMGLWLLLQDILTLRLNLWIFSGLILSCLVLYPTAMYTYWNWGAIHPFKAMKLLFTAIGAGAAGSGIYLLSLIERQNPLFESVMLSPFNFTEFLIVVNLAVLLSFIIHYRRANLFNEVYTNYQKHLISLSGLSLEEQAQINGLLAGLDPIPLKTHTKRRLKTRAIEKYSLSDSDRSEEAWVRHFIRAHCIDMNWMYWTGSAAQWTLIILLISKLVWARDTGLMVSADYFRQGLTSGMVFGALVLSVGVFYPINRCFRELLYQGSLFSMKQMWLLSGLALMGVSVILLSGLVPSRFLWGGAVNPAPHPWGLLVLLGLILLLQFFKSDPRLPALNQDEK